VTPSDLAILEADSWFSRIPDERRRLLLEEATVRSLAAGARIYGAGDPPGGLWAVVEGQVQLKGYPAVGLELPLPAFGPGTWFGETSTLDGLPRQTDAAAVETSRVLHVSEAAVARAAATAPALYRDLGALASLRQRMALAFYALSAAHPVGDRLALILAGLSQDGRSAVRMRQEDLARLVGVSRQTLNRHLRALERCGIVQLAYAEITILELSCLLATRTNNGP
jgi:CRP/FNR family transcriptional regulator, cyclic AMP receptor protein